MEFYLNGEEIKKILKQILIKVSVLVLYDTSKTLTLSEDASSIGLRAVLIQDGHPITYAFNKFK